MRIVRFNVAGIVALWISCVEARIRVSDAPRRVRQDLADMVGTTLSRIGVFLKRFHELGLISINGRGHLIVSEDKLTDYVARSTFDSSTDTNRSRISRILEI